MPNLASTLKSEITRLAKREIRSEIAGLQKASAAHRRHIAELKRQLADLQRQAAQLAKRSRAAQSAPAPAPEKDSSRFQARGLRSLRARLGLSQADMAKLLGVSALSIYNWEGGKSVPRRESLAAIVALRGIGKREARARLG
jgi:DNA-binding XRE family transcriptional regulator